MRKKHSNDKVKKYLQVCKGELSEVKKYIVARSNDEIVEIQAELAEMHEGNRLWEALFPYVAIFAAIIIPFDHRSPIFTVFFSLLILFLAVFYAFDRIKSNGEYKKGIFYLETYGRIKR